jgi:hypothetical protein
LICVRPSKKTPKTPESIRIPPLALTAPEPEIVPLVSVNSPLTVIPPVPVSVPPVIERTLLIVDAAAIEIVPPEIVNGSDEVRLLIESVTAFECMTSAATLIVTSSAEPGTLSVLQFAGVSQLLSPPPPVQKTADSSVLSSIHFTRGR